MYLYYHKRSMAVSNGGHGQQHGPGGSIQAAGYKQTAAAHSSSYCRCGLPACQQQQPPEHGDHPGCPDIYTQLLLHDIGCGSRVQRKQSAKVAVGSSAEGAIIAEGPAAQRTISFISSLHYNYVQVITGRYW